MVSSIFSCSISLQVRHFLEGDGKAYFPFQDQIKHQVRHPRLADPSGNAHSQSSAQVDRHIRKLYLVLGRYNGAPYHLKKAYAEEVYKLYLKKGGSRFVTVDEELVKVRFSI